jgi:hypothetical protein
MLIMESDIAKCIFFLIGSRPWSIVVFQQGCWFFWLEFQRLIFFSFSCLLLSRIILIKRGLHLGHDVLFRHGVIATNTIVIPYNREHVALHEGLFPGILDWQNRSFTAGGSSSDIEIQN